MAIGEAGSITTNSPAENQPITVNLTEPLDDPVFAFTATGNGPDSFNIRLTGQTFDADGNTTSFTFIIEEWEHLDGPHPAVETINWLAVEEGVHTLPDGRTIEAGTSAISSTGQNTGGSATFNGGFTDPPVVLTSVMSNNDTTTVDSDPSAITATGFDITLQEEEGEDGVHAAETIGWIAIQAGGDATSGTASVSGDTVTDTVSTFGLGATFNDSVVLSETQTLDGPDTATVTIADQTDSTVSVFIDEEQSRDGETGHTTEVVGIIAFEDGLIPCFAGDTLVTVALGEKPIRTLEVGDAVLTVENGLQEICWIGHQLYAKPVLSSYPQLYPVRITQGALGQDLPKRDLLVSRQHRILVRSKVAARMFGKSEVLVAAAKLVGLPGIYIDETVAQVTYVHVLFDKHQLIYAEGTLAESLYTGPEAIRALSATAQDQIRAILPEAADANAGLRAARHIPTGRQQKQLVARHLRNEKPLLM